MDIRSIWQGVVWFLAKPLSALYRVEPMIDAFTSGNLS